MASHIESQNTSLVFTLFYLAQLAKAESNFGYRIYILEKFRLAQEAALLCLIDYLEPTKPWNFLEFWYRFSTYFIELLLKWRRKRKRNKNERGKAMTHRKNTMLQNYGISHSFRRFLFVLYFNHSFYLDFDLSTNKSTALHNIVDLDPLNSTVLEHNSLTLLL